MGGGGNFSSQPTEQQYLFERKKAQFLFEKDCGPDVKNESEMFDANIVAHELKINALLGPF